MTRYFGAYDLATNEFSMVISSESREEFMLWLREFCQIPDDKTDTDIETEFAKEGQTFVECTVVRL